MALITVLAALLFGASCGWRGGNASPMPRQWTNMQTAGCSGMALGIDADFNGLLPLPADNAWNQDVSAAPVDPDSSSIINYIGAGEPLHPDFDAHGGIPYLVVDSSITPFVNLRLTDPSQSDVVPVPFPAGAPIETGTDHHVLVVDRRTCLLYEVWRGSFADDQWAADNGAVWDLRNYDARPYTWTSADAAGLPILPGLVRYDEADSGEIRHALRFTVPRTRGAMVAPATHWAATNRGSPIPMGMRLRLKSSVDISHFSRLNQVIFTAMKKYGLILADNGSEMYVTGAPDDRWSWLGLREWRDLKASDFEVVKMPALITDSNVPTGPAPHISAFVASPKSTSAGSQVMLQWNATGASYYYVNPDVGFVRGTTVTVSPKSTTTYILTATGAYGRTTATVTVTLK